MDEGQGPGSRITRNCVWGVKRAFSINLLIVILIHMKQHPIPQDIASYEFRLVGDMTLKQFFELAGGIAVAVFFYILPIHSFFRIPLIILSAFTGVAMAFFPVEERPLDVWFKNFIKSITQPTQFIWKKRAITPPAFEFTYHKKTNIKEDKNQKQTKDLQSFLKTLPNTQHGSEKNDQQIARINDLLQNLEPQKVSVQKTYQEKPEAEEKQKPEVKVRKLSSKKDLKKDQTVYTSLVQKRPVEIKKEKLLKIKKDREEPLINNHENNFQKKPQVKPAEPLTPPLKVENRRKDQKFSEAEFEKKLPIPQKPDIPNLLVGMVLDSKSKILPNALIEIQDSKGNIVRALKTNKLGQFYTATPLKNGSYKIIPEHELFEFDIITLELEGEIVDPLRIQAQKKRIVKEEEKKEHIELY